MFDPLNLVNLGFVVATGAAGSGVWAGVSALARYRNTRSPLRKLYKPLLSKPLWVILSAVESSDETEYYRFLTPIDGVYTYSSILRYFNDMHFKCIIDARFSTEINNDTSQDNIVLIGGYENNGVSSAFNGRNGRHFYLDNNQIKEKNGRCSLGIELDGNGRIITDYCLVTRMPNPSCSKANGGLSTLIAFEGVRHFGTIGGVREFNERAYYKLSKLGLDPGNSSQIEIVYKFNIHYLPSSFSISEGTLLYYYADGDIVYAQS